MEERENKMSLGDVCNLLGWTMLILGTIGAFILANVFGTETRGYYYSYEARDWNTTLAIFFGTLLPVCATSFQLLATARIMEVQQKIQEKLNAN